MRIVVLLASLLAAHSALANPRPLAFSYPSEMLPKNGLEIEQFVDLTPVRAFDVSGAESWVNRSVLTTEIEFGLADRLELGLYFQLSDDPGSGAGAAPLRFDGMKQRLRWLLADPGEWPIDVALYGEVAELQQEIELEAKVILQRRFGPLQAIVNLWGERELYYAGRREWVLHPTAGVSWELSPAVHLGLEWWMNAELGAEVPAAGPGRFNASAHHYLGPALMMQFKHLWWLVSPYVRLDDWSRPSQLGDQFGRVWVRSVIGIDL